MKIIGIVPARKGSKRLPGKNMAILNGKPLLRHAIEGAKKSEVLDKIIVTSDWEDCIELAGCMGVDGIDQPSAREYDDQAHDFQFVKHCIQEYPGYDVFVILRPTSPFRTADTIYRAVERFLTVKPDSLRAVEPTKHHPCKSWVMVGNHTMVPYNGYNENKSIQDFDLPTQVFQRVYCQNGCIHVGWTSNLRRFGNISGYRITPLFTVGLEGFDINTEDDLRYAEWIMKGKP